MDKVILEFVKDLTSRQRKFVEESSEKDAGTVAAGLFGNEEFCSVIFELFNPGYFKETKLELPTDSKNRVIYTLDEILKAIDKRLEELK